MKKEFRNTVLFVVIGFILGIGFCVTAYIGYKKTKPLIAKVKHKLKERWIANLPKAKSVLVLSDFEDENQLKRWNTASAAINISRENAISGKGSAEIIFYSAKGAAAVKLEDFFESHRKEANWSGYEVLVFDLYNPGKSRERIILQIKDAKGNKIKRDLYLDGGKKRRFEVDIASLWNELYPTRISQFNLFLWNNNKEKKFYLDNVKLVPQAVAQAEKRSIFAPSSLPRPGENTYSLGDYFGIDLKKWQDDSGYLRIPLNLKSYYSLPESIEGVWRGGVPLPKGKIYGVDKFNVVDESGIILPAQFKPLAFWPDKSIKWVLVTARTALKAEGSKLFLVYGRKYAGSYKKPVVLKDDDKGITASNGIIQLSLPRRSGVLADKVWYDYNGDGVFADSEVVARDVNTVLEHNEQRYSGANDNNAVLTVEENGPVSVCLRKEGWFINSRKGKYCKYIVRIYLYANDSRVKVKHTLVYTGYPENKFHYLYKGKRLPRNETIGQFGIEFTLDNISFVNIYYQLNEQEISAMADKPFSIFQVDDKRIKISQNGTELAGDNRFNGAMVLAGKLASVGVMVKEFWQQYPKRIGYEPQKQRVFVDLWPKEGGELDLRTTEAAYGPDAVARGSAFGLAKTHDLVLDFGRKENEEKSFERMRAFLADIVILPSSRWVSDTVALGRLPPVDYNDVLLRAKESFIEDLFSWGKRQIERFRWYGMIDFGDTLSWYREKDYVKDYGGWGWHPVGRWGWFNCEAVGNHAGALLQFWRSQDYDYYLFGARLARHIMDIDTCHYNTVANDRRLRGRIPDDYSQVGSMHRHNGNHWGGRNEETSHTNITGLVYYYFLSGDERAREVIEEVGSFFLKERITYFRHPDIAPQRNIANVLWGDVLLYEITQDSRYKKGADKMAEILYRGQRYDGTWLDTYNPVRKRWEGKPSDMFLINYTMPALIAYHRLTQNKAIKESILSATDYIMEHTPYTPYFDVLTYSYWLSGDDKYIYKAKERLKYFIQHQRNSKDPLWDGMIYQKLYYSRVMEFLYHTPFASLDIYRPVHQPANTHKEIGVDKGKIK